MYIVLGILIISILILTPFIHSYALKIGFVDKNILNLSKQKIPIIGGPIILIPFLIIIFFTNIDKDYNYLFFSCSILLKSIH